ncbi:hypothetical protein BP6252_06093 [Coleophoma cylindrospora]|uniref:FAD-binding domain-containing protein n=1 Tax=Coleophoma cylindrospora TaxID=1849047 RepID=A0A3D8RMC6_9HELO|nr:hypothetical protein BP6252_06093 [Coleophoma cylindrospora]
MPLQEPPGPSLRVAIIGGGPAGLGAAIEFAKLPFVDWNLYEKATSFREIGAGISIQPSTWRLLEVMGAAANLKPHDFYRPPENHRVQHRNGRTGELLQADEQTGVPENQLHARTHRAKLQLAMLKEVDQNRVRLSSRLIKVDRMPSGKLLIEFQDGFIDEVDLLVGADGIRSVVRDFAFPNHSVRYIGRTSYRTVVTSDEIATVEGVPDAVTFWHGPSCWMYTCNLGDGKFEITTNTSEPSNEKEKVSWGQEATVEDNAKHFKDFCPVVKAVAALPKEMKQFALFAGPRLDTVIAHGSVALVGDASHPLSGAFGSGAGFALEDAYALTRTIAWAHKQNVNLQDGLELYDKIRGAHYRKLYGILDQNAEADVYIKAANLGFDETVDAVVGRKWTQKNNWVTKYDIQKDLKEMLEKETSHLS